MTIPSRRWPTATNSSRREKTSLTGRPAARASAATCPSKWKSHFAPKPPPRSGTITRTFDSGIPRVSRDAGARGVRDLRRRPDRHPVALPLRDDRARLDGYALHGVGDVAPAYDDVRARERGVDVALHDRREAEHVVVPAERLVALVRLPVGVHERRVVGERGLEVGHDGQRLELDLDEGRRLCARSRASVRRRRRRCRPRSARCPARTAAGP